MSLAVKTPVSSAEEKSDLVAVFCCVLFLSVPVLLALFIGARSPKSEIKNRYPESIEAIKVLRAGISHLKPAVFVLPYFSESEVVDACRPVRLLHSVMSTKFTGKNSIDPDVSSLTARFVAKCDEFEKVARAKGGLDVRVAYAEADAIEKTADKNGTFSTYEHFKVDVAH